MATGNQKLTDKMERYAQNLFQGEDQNDAYQKAYPNSNMNPNALAVQASRLAKNPKIVLRVAELRNAAVIPLIADVVERKEHATKVMRNPSNRVRDQLAANKLLGDYEGSFVDKDKQASAPISFTLIIGEKQLIINEPTEEPPALAEGEE